MLTSQAYFNTEANIFLLAKHFIFVSYFIVTKDSIGS